MSLKLSKRVEVLKPSPTLAMAAKARELAEKGKDVVNLTVGEPDWPTVEVANRAAIEAIQKNFTKYTAAQGIVELRQAVAAATNKDLGTQYTADQVVVGAGAKYVIFAALQLTIDPGDEVLIPAPFWVSYPTMVELAGGIPRIIECSARDNFKLTASALKGALTEKTKALILCSPSNPTGMSYTADELKSLAGVLSSRRDVFVISDDIYNQLNFSGDKVAPHLLQADPSLADQTLVVNGASKSFSMTGWRVGWGLGPKNLIKPLGDFLSQSTSNVSSIGQKAALAALGNIAEETAKARLLLRQRREKALAGFANIKGFRVYPPDGAFYLWVDVSALFGKAHKSGVKVTSSKDFCELLLNEYYVATVPGAEFGAEGFMRISFAVKDETFEKALSRLSQLSQDLHQ